MSSSWLLQDLRACCLWRKCPRPEIPTCKRAVGVDGGGLSFSWRTSGEALRESYFGGVIATSRMGETASVGGVKKPLLVIESGE